MKFEDIPQMTRDGNYRVHVSWKYLEEQIKRDYDDLEIDLDPDFQRAHVWSEEQQRRFVEFKLRGGTGSDELRFNCAGWQNDYRGPYVLVDGKQRLEAVRKFMRDELEIFDGAKFSDFEDSIRVTKTRFIWCVNDLKTRKEVLQWYLDINTGGVVHSDEEIEKVRKLLEKE